MRGLAGRYLDNVNLVLSRRTFAEERAHLRAAYDVGLTFTFERPGTEPSLADTGSLDDIAMILRDQNSQGILGTEIIVRLAAEVMAEFPPEATYGFLGLRTAAVLIQAQFDSLYPDRQQYVSLDAAVVEGYAVETLGIDTIPYHAALRHCFGNVASFSQHLALRWFDRHMPVHAARLRQAWRLAEESSDAVVLPFRRLPKVDAADRQ